MAYVSAQAFVRQVEGYYRKATILEPALCNNNYEGDIKANETVHIISISDVTVDNYSDTPWNDSDWDEVAETEQSFTISQKKMVRLRVPHTVKPTSLPRLMESGAENAAYQLADTADTYIGTFHSQITTNVLGSTAAPQIIGFDETAGEMLPSQAFGELYQKISNSNGDLSGPNAAIPGWVAKALLFELKSRNTGFGDQVLRTGAGQGKLELGGAIEGINGFYVSNNIATAAAGDGSGETAYKIMVGTPKSSITFARRIVESKFLEMQNDFADLMKGLHVYGGLIPFEKHMALGTFRKGHWPNGVSL